MSSHKIQGTHTISCSGGRSCLYKERQLASVQSAEVPALLTNSCVVSLPTMNPSLAAILFCLVQSAVVQSVAVIHIDTATQLPSMLPSTSSSPLSPPQYKYGLNQSQSTCVLNRRRYLLVEYPGCSSALTTVHQCEGVAYSANFYTLDPAPFINTITACCKPTEKKRKKRKLTFDCNGHQETHTIYFYQPRSCELEINGRKEVLYVQQS